MAATKTQNLSQALVAAQADMPALQRNALNPHFSSKFISLDSLLENVLPVLNKHDLALIQTPTVLDGEPALTTRLWHGATGEFIEDTMLLVMDKSNPQGQGSGITYARRYSLQAILGLAAEQDDDGNAATAGRENKTVTRRSGVANSTGRTSSAL